MGDIVTSLPQLEQETKYTYADYLEWDEGRWELINGAVWDMTPAPSRLQQSVEDILRQLCEWKKLKVLEINVQEDHVHMVVSIPSKFSVSETVGFLKGKCAIKIFDRHLELKKRYWGSHFGRKDTA